MRLTADGKLIDPKLIGSSDSPPPGQDQHWCTFAEILGSIDNQHLILKVHLILTKKKF
jgi:hypothetical protein